MSASSYLERRGRSSGKQFFLAGRIVGFVTHGSIGIFNGKGIRVIAASAKLCTYTSMAFSNRSLFRLMGTSSCKTLTACRIHLLHRPFAALHELAQLPVNPRAQRFHHVIGQRKTSGLRRVGDADGGDKSMRGSERKTAVRKMA